MSIKEKIYRFLLGGDSEVYPLLQENPESRDDESGNLEMKLEKLRNVGYSPSENQLGTFDTY